MFGIWLLLSFLQVSPSLTVQAASLPLPFQHAPITLTETKNLTIANHASVPFTNPSNELSLIFVNPGISIPASELRHTLGAASADVQNYLPHYAYSPISDGSFEKNISFPETKDSVSISVYSYGFGLSWLQLSQVLMLTQQYMLGMGPGHPDTHCQQLDFYVQVTAAIEIAHGVVKFAPGARAVAKRNLITTTLQQQHANFSSPNTPTLPIIFNIAKTNLALNIISLGVPIPPSTVLITIESAFTDVVLHHTDMDSPIPAHQPFSFNETSGKRAELFTTVIRIAPYPGKQISWGLLCILLYGLRDFMSETEHFNVVNFEVNDARAGRLGSGDVQYLPTVAETASTARLRMRHRGRFMRAAV